MAEWIDVAPAEDFEPGSWRTIEYDDRVIAVFNLDGDFYAIEDICTHDGAELTGGEIEGTEIVCPRHGARFDIITGEALTPPAYEDIDTFEVRVKDGTVQVNVEPD
jgi:3-phenylpropionate/trans-cinnamate dioxygenase ferredoxin subunit